MKMGKMYNKTHIIVMLILAVCILGSKVLHARSIFDYDEVVFQPYCSFSETSRRNLIMYPLKRKQGEVGENSSDSIYYKMQANGEDFVNPFVVSSLVISNLLSYNRGGKKDHEQLEQCIQIMKIIKGTYERHEYFPRPAYKIFKEGWSSSLDAPTVMVASRMLYEVTGDEV